MRLKEDDSSWKAGGIKRRDFRHDPGLPETEIPRHTGLKRKKKKHEHNYVQRKIGKEIIVRHYRLANGALQRYETEVDKVIWVCERCGNKKRHYYPFYYRY